MADIKDKYTLQTIVKKCLEQAFYKIPKIDVYESSDELICKFSLDVSDYKIWPRNLIRKTLRKEFPDKKISMTSMANKGWGVGGHIYGYDIDIRISDKEEKIVETNVMEEFKYPFTVRVTVTKGDEDEKHGHMEDWQVLDTFFDSLPDMLTDLRGDAIYGYSGPISVDINFQYKNSAMDFIKSLRRDVFDVKLINKVSSMHEGSLSVRHTNYVLDNVMNWIRSNKFDKRSLKQIAKACERYDNDYSAQEYADIIKEYGLLDRPTKNSKYSTVDFL